MTASLTDALLADARLKVVDVDADSQNYALECGGNSFETAVSLATVWQQLGNSLAMVWQQLGNSLATTWQQLGNSLATALKALGDSEFTLKQGIRVVLSQLGVNMLIASFSC